MQYIVPRPAHAYHFQASKAKKVTEEEREAQRKADSLTEDQWRLVTDNLELAYWWLERIKRGYPISALDEDGEGIAVMALIKAAKKYNPNHRIKDEEGNDTARAVKFGTYAAWWLRSQLMNEVRRHYRKHLTLLSDIEDSINVDPEDYRTSSPDRHLTIMDRLNRVKKWFRKVDWQVFTWFYVDGLREADVAEKLGIAPQRVHQMLERIRGRVKQLKADGRIS